MDVLQTKVKLQFALVYLDDIVIFSHTPGDHIKHVRSFLKLINDANVSVNLKKSEIITNFIDTSDPVSRLECFEVSTWRNDAVCRLEHPTILM